MRKNAARLLLIASAFLLVSLAFQRPVHAFTETCPPGYTGPESIQEGCCLSLPGRPKAVYYEYRCVDGVPQGNATMVCSSLPCPV
jgi:hypothetical protein